MKKFLSLISLVSALTAASAATASQISVVDYNNYLRPGESIPLRRVFGGSIGGCGTRLRSLTVNAANYDNFNVGQISLLVDGSYDSWNYVSGSARQPYMNRVQLNYSPYRNELCSQIQGTQLVNTGNTLVYVGRLEMLFDYPYGPPPPPAPYPGRAAACFFVNYQFSGPSFCLRDGETIANLANFSAPGSYNWNDVLSSISIEQPGVVVEVYRDQRFSGESAVFTGSISQLPPRFQDSISSIRVYRRY